MLTTYDLFKLFTYKYPTTPEIVDDQKMKPMTVTDAWWKRPVTVIGFIFRSSTISGVVGYLEVNNLNKSYVVSIFCPLLHFVQASCMSLS